MDYVVIVVFWLFKSMEALCWSIFCCRVFVNKISNSSYCHLDTYVTLVSLILRCSISFMSYTCELEKHYFFPLSLSPSLQPRNFNKIKHRNTNMIIFFISICGCHRKLWPAFLPSFASSRFKASTIQVSSLLPLFCYFVEP